MKKKLNRINKGKVIEKISIYTLLERIKYWINNNYFTGFRIPSNLDIHINNVWKDLLRTNNK